MGDSQLVRTPIPVPAYFKRAEESFSLKRRGRPASQNLTPRPPVKTALPLSRVFPSRRQQAWSHPRPQSVSSKEPAPRRLSSRVYDESKEEPYFEQCFQKISKLGHGSFGEVFKVRSKEDGRLYAVKCSMELFRGESDRARKLAEARKHEALGAHANLVGFVRAWEERRRLYIQTELCEGGSLQEEAETRGGPFPEAQVWAILHDLASALGHLHRQRLAHLDVKPANAFLTAGGRHCKLGDFGLLLELEGAPAGEAQEGDPVYMAPELLDGVYSTAADVFSLGLTILEICCNLDLPRSGEAWQKLRQAYLPPEFVSGLSPSLLEVLRSMLHPDFHQRITIEELLTLPALQKAQRWRKIRHLLDSAVSWSLSLYTWLISLLAGLWRTVSWPVGRLLCPVLCPCPRSPVQPRNEAPGGTSSDWEDGSSLRGFPDRDGADEEEDGEDVFGASSETGPRHSGFSPVRGSPFPRENRSLCGNGLYCVEDVNACPTSTPRHTSDGGRSVWKGSPNVSGISQDSPCRVYPPSAHQLDVEDEGQAAGTALFMPRNLLSLFDQSMECD